jgi:hypothetical protein
MENLMLRGLKSRRGKDVTQSFHRGDDEELHVLHDEIGRHNQGSCTFLSDPGIFRRDCPAAPLVVADSACSVEMASAFRSLE